MRKTNFNLILLNSIFMIGLVMSNLFGGKIITVLGFTVAGAIVTYPLTSFSQPTLSAKSGGNKRQTSA